ncbi:hypothetical protein CONLIGDRAFT_162572 [Coniochaeta ligniaria NRRL 30616]|uniref:C2H2-type domain-containing protein n=1 Tax=Coniochaeta ligniaria NRRL 30616 TaxID=1408157 RepID=A0A1J7JZ22_9PEZI|nr:hypothetical protein CONLIGDRAFT_162572 [Coniochaeta ligniaria NRRL 30616]
MVRLSPSLHLGESSSSALFDNLSALPYLNHLPSISVDGKPLIAQAPSPPEKQSEAGPSATSSEDPPGLPPPPRNKRYPCSYPQCRRVWSTAQALAQHKRCHTKRYACKEERCHKAGVGFGTRRDLDRHQSAVHMGKRQKCPHCGRMVKRQDNLARHIFTVHKNA